MDNLMWILWFFAFGGLFIIWEIGDLISSKSSLLDSQTEINKIQANLLKKELKS